MDDLAWMEPIYQKFDELRATVNEQKVAQAKDGGTRFCVDYRKLNAIAKKDSYPLPRVDTYLQSFYGSIWFCTLDLNGYFSPTQVLCAIYLTAIFCTRFIYIILLIKNDLNITA